ncbi:MAG: hypothetical protein FWD76_05285 [Firmicutes bacterium]|nr:hypothetical protein [Bacillota bacterium]
MIKIIWFVLLGAFAVLGVWRIVLIAVSCKCTKLRGRWSRALYVGKKRSVIALAILLLCGLVSVVGFVIDFVGKTGVGQEYFLIVLQVGIWIVWVHFVSIEVQAMVTVSREEETGQPAF